MLLRSAWRHKVEPWRSITRPYSENAYKILRLDHVVDLDRIDGKTFFPSALLESYKANHSLLTLEQKDKNKK